MTDDVPLAVFEEYQSLDGITMRTSQSMYNVNIEVRGPIQWLCARFTTPSSVVLQDITISNIVLPEGATIHKNEVSFKDWTPGGRKIWRLCVFYDPQRLPGTSTYTMTIRDETFYITSDFATV